MSWLRELVRLRMVPTPSPDCNPTSFRSLWSLVTAGERARSVAERASSRAAIRKEPRGISGLTMALPCGTSVDSWRMLAETAAEANASNSRSDTTTRSLAWKSPSAMPNRAGGAQPSPSEEHSSSAGDSTSELHRASKFRAFGPVPRPSKLQEDALAKENPGTLDFRMASSRHGV